MELVTREITFLELQEDKAKIQKHLLSDIHPLSFSRVPEGYIRNFILKCWQPRELRPSPAELLCDPWFAAVLFLFFYKELMRRSTSNFIRHFAD